MTTITQTVPNYIQGISEQPDELKAPGQLTEAKNVIPDITRGLIKRPGSKLVGALGSSATTAGCWFSYYRDAGEQYIGKVYRDGSAKIWNCLTGTASTISANSYLVHSNDGELQFLTINDNTYVTNRTKTVAMTGTTPARPDTHAAYIELKKTSNARQYGLNLYDSDTTQDVYTATRLNVDTSYSVSHSTVGDENGNPVTSGECPDISTQVWSSEQIANSAITVGSGNTVNVANKKNLIWRFTVTGVSGPRGINADVTQGNHYKCIYQYEVDILHGGEGWEAGDKLTFVQDSITYRIEVAKHEKATVKANIALVRPEPTPFDAQMAVSKDAILGGIKEGIGTTLGSAANVEIIGNGLYLKRSSAFNVSTTENDLMNIITSEVNDVGDLPTQCKHGYIIKIANSSSEEDDYYLKFEGDNGKDGTGSWVECAKPHTSSDPVTLGFDSSTMPIRIQRTGVNTFAYNTPSWTNRTVGDTLTNKEPSFVGKKIDKVLFWRNRLVFLAQENAILSQPGNFDNFWNESALTVSPIDRIDIAASSTFPTDLVDGIETNSGLMLFGDNQQFLLTTDSDLLTPDTAKINSLCTYNYNKLVPPVSLGTTYAFIDNAGKYTRFFEMNNVRREGEPEVLEQSKIISRFLASDIDRVANSRENSFVMLGKSGTKTIYGYRYFNSGRERLQQAWFTWELSNNLQYHTILDDIYYAVLSDNNLLSFPLKDTANDPSVTADSVYMPVHLDNWVVVNASALTYNSTTRKTTFSVPTGIDTSKALSVVDTTAGTNYARIGTPTLVSGNLELPGDWSSNNLYLGYTFEMSILFPRFFVTKTANNITKSDVHASLVIHRAQLDLGSTGVYTINLKRKGREDYNVDVESAFADEYVAETPGFESEQIKTVPIYDRNINVNLYLKSTHPSPATLYSLSWEGDYSSKYYKRV